MTEQTPDEANPQQLDVAATEPPEFDGPDSEDDLDVELIDAAVDAFFDAVNAPAPVPVNWRTLGPDEAEHEWLTLNEWVHWLRHEFSLPPSIIPPAWHRHPELVWELSALHLRWLGCYDPAQNAAGPLAFMTDFAAARARLREWVTSCGTRLDVDRPSRQTRWPGEPDMPETVEAPITHREEDFSDFVIADVQRREDAEAEALWRLGQGK